MLVFRQKFVVRFSAEDACRRAGGARVTLSVNAVRKVDLTGDGAMTTLLIFTKPNASDVRPSSAAPAAAIF
ncbi:MAG: hypothetical protein WA770_26320 [Pseudolabrys sp.]